MTKGLRGKNAYEVTDAGGVTYACEICGKPVEKTPDEAKKFLRNGDLPSHFDFMCPKCYYEVEEQTAKQGRKPDDRQEQIAFGQSWNLGVSVMAGRNPDLMGEAELRTDIERWQRYFYDKLTNRSQTN